MLFAAAAAGVLLAPTSASVHADGVGVGIGNSLPVYADGAGARIGAFAAATGPGYAEGRGRHHEGGCRVARERVETPSGRVIFRSHRTCE
jgi:hypothetical protein